MSAFVSRRRSAWRSRRQRFLEPLESRLLLSGVTEFPSAQWPVGDSPQGSLTGDFDEDGMADLAIVSQDSGSVSILLNRAGQFSDRTDYSTSATGSRTGAVGDFNGDNHLDLAVANYSAHNVSILLGAGDGTFSAATLFATGVRPTAIRTLDADGNGWLDLVTANEYDDTISILPGDGAGGFGSATHYAVGDQPAGVAAQDLNRDGAADLVVANNRDHTLSLLLNDGTGTFSAAVDIPVSSYPKDVRAVDFDGDGEVDLISGGSSSVTLLAGDGSGSFVERDRLVYSPATLTSIAVHDVNADGLVDIVATHADLSTTLSVRLGQAAGAFGSVIASYAGPSPASLTLADFDGDSRLDVAVTNPSLPIGPATEGVITVAAGMGDGRFAARRFPVGDSPRDLATADYNGDGVLDMATVNYSDDTVSLLLGDGEGELLDGGAYAVSERMEADRPNYIAAGDLNEDGHLDVVVSHSGGLSGGAISVLLNAGDGTLQTGELMPFGFGGYSRLKLLDVDRDGHLDLLTTEPNVNDVVILFGDGTGNLVRESRFDAGSRPVEVVACDVFGDEHIDLVTVDATGDTVSVLPGGTDPLFAEPISFPTGDKPVSLVCVDLNEDDWPDLVTANEDSDSISVLLNAQDDTFLAPVSYPAGRGTDIRPMMLQAADVNRDGHLDLVVVNEQSGTATVWQGAGDGTLASGGEFALSGLPRSLAVGNFNADAFPDLATVDSNGDSASVLLNRVGWFSQILSPARSGEILAGDALRFHGIGDVARQPLSFEWSFGAERTSLTAAPGLVSFPTAGTQQVTLAAVNGDGVLDPRPAERTIEVVPDSGPIADLVVRPIDITSTIAPGIPFEVSYTVDNRGNESVSGATWSDAIYLSDDPFLDTRDILLASTNISVDMMPDDSYTSSLDITIPRSAEGVSYVIVSVDDNWQLLERHQLNNEVSAEVTAAIPWLVPDVATESRLSRAARENHYRIAIDSGEHLLVRLDDLDDLATNELYFRKGLPASRSHYDLRTIDSTSADQTLLLADPTPGIWYVMVYGTTLSGENRYSILAETSRLALLETSPARSAIPVPTTLHLSGAGFGDDTVVELVAGDDTIYSPDVLERHSENAMTAVFAADRLPAGVYTVRTRDATGHRSELAQALEIVASGQPFFATDLVLPAGVGRHNLSTLYVTYENTGDVGIVAPLLSLRASDEALMTLDGERAFNQAFLDELPPGFSDRLYFLAMGEQAGLLQPGESGRVPVYWVGLQQPWDFADYEVEFDVLGIGSENDALMDWEAIAVDSRPNWASDDVWEILAGALRLRVGESWGEYVRVLNDNSAYLDELGARVIDVERLQGFVFRQLDGFFPERYLSTAVDAAVPSAVSPLLFPRAYAPSISRRYELGPLGRGWAHPWQLRLEIADNASITLHDMTGTPRQFAYDDHYDTYRTSPGDTGILSRVDSGYRLDDGDGSVYGFDHEGLLLYVEDPDGFRVTAEHTDGRLTSLEHEHGGALQITYNDAGRIASVSDDNQRTTQYRYDTSNEHLVEVEYFDGRIVGYAYQGGVSAASEHALTEVAYPDGSHQFFDYNADGTIAAMYRDGGAELVSFQYDRGTVTATADDQVQHFRFDQHGALVQYEDGLGHHWTREFDPRNNLATTRDPAGNEYQFWHGSGREDTLIRDPLGHQTLVTPFFAESGATQFQVQDANHHATVLSYNPADDLVSIRYEDGTTESWEYWDGLEPSSWTNRREETTRFEYEQGRLTRIVNPDGTHNSYEYDVRGNLLRATGATGTIEMTYDSRDRVERITYPGGRYLDYQYDDAGRRALMSDQLGRSLQYQYDAAGRLATVTDESSNVLVGYEYNNSGKVVRRELGNDVYTTYAFDSAGRTTTVTNWNPDDTVLSRFEYAYDATRQRSIMTTLEGTWTYDYDEVGRLLSASFESFSTSTADVELTYEYDAVGNRVRTTTQGLPSQYSTNEMNQYTVVDDVSYTFDEDGNLLSELSGDIQTTYEYDALKRLVAVERETDRWEFTYDALGQRSVVSLNGVLSHFVVDPWGLGNVVGQYDHDGNFVAGYDYGYELITQMRDGGDESYYVFDAMGNTANLTDSTGSPLNAYSYLPFGALQDSEEAVPNPFQFGGAWGVTHDGTDLHFMRSRYYAAHLGRFLTEDPLRLTGGDVNLYTFANNDPINFHDPLGERWSCGQVSAEGDVPAHSFGWSAGRTVGTSAGISVGAGLGGGIGIGPGGTAGAAANWGIADFGWGAQAGAQIQVFHGIASGFSLGWSHGTTDGWFCGWSEDPADPAADEDEGGEEDDERWDIGPGPSGGSDAGGGGGGGTGPGGSGGGGTGGSSDTVSSVDPNSKTGPAGFGTRHYVANDQLLAFRIDFENDVLATAPAQHVLITDFLDPRFDWTTFQLTEFGFGDVRVHLPPGTQYHSATVRAVIENQPLDVEVRLGIDASSGLITAVFAAMDPATGLPPADVFTGFLPPEDGTGRGQGYFSYLIELQPALPSGTEIRNVATIQFDFGETIDTNQIDPHDPSQGTDPEKEAPIVIDSGWPTSTVEALPSVVTETFEVNWTGSDDASGVVAYAVYVAENGGPYQRWLANTSATAETFTGVPGSSYAFYTIAMDGVGHLERQPDQADSTTTVSSFPWHNFENRLDVNDDGLVIPQDALIIINEINARGSHPLPEPPIPPVVPPPYYDVYRDTWVSPIDVLLVINYLNKQRGAGEGEWGVTQFVGLDMAQLHSALTGGRFASPGQSATVVSASEPAPREPRLPSTCPIGWPHEEPSLGGSCSTQRRALLPAAVDELMTHLDEWQSQLDSVLGKLNSLLHKR